ncbi:hypothetical protein KL938_005359 [Ogataea parapolymorpha]|nr:hypothetical protein KL938_005359 [Ogataea parapolymorpha]
MGTSQTRPACSPSRAGMSGEGVWMSFTGQVGRQGQQGPTHNIFSGNFSGRLFVPFKSAPRRLAPLAGSSGRWHPDYAFSDRAENPTTPN